MFQQEPDDFDDEEDFILNEYAIDDSLDSMTRLERYHTSDFSLQRLVLVRELSDTAHEHGYTETHKRLLPLLGNFVADSEPAVRHMFVDQLFPLAKFLIEKGGDQGYNELINTFLPYTFELLVDKNVEVGAAAVSALVKLVDLVKSEQVEPQLLSVVVTLAHDERAEDYRVVAAQLFNELAPRLGEKLCKDTVIQEVTTLSEDMSFSVRKTVACNSGKICKVVEAEYSCQKLFPVYLALSRDDIWGVRKACAESICQMSEGITPEYRTTALFEIFERFTEDVSRWVRVAAYQQLGAFISTYQKGEVSSALLKYFTDMAATSESSTDSDLAEYCAYNFPAVTLAVGKERWGELDNAYQTLVKDVQWKVRKSLAHSLHEIARIVGRDITEKHLTTAFDLFLRDLDEVKIGVVNNIAEFVEVLGEDQREEYIPLIYNLPNETDNWRLRNIIAKKLGKLATLVKPATCRKYIAELGIKLLEDSVADVRSSSYKSAGYILKRLYQGDASDKTDFLKYLTTLPSHQSYQTRQMFVYIAQAIAELEAEDPSLKIFTESFMDPLVRLGDDPVPNVRLAVAKVVSETLVHFSQFKNTGKVQPLKEKLLKDKDRDVVSFAAQEVTRPDPSKEGSVN